MSLNAIEKTKNGVSRLVHAVSIDRLMCVVWIIRLREHLVRCIEHRRG